jgi:hypothetical protein
MSKPSASLRFSAIVLATMLVAGPGNAAPADIPGCGTELFREDFDEANLIGQGWYDGATATIDTAQHAPDSAASLVCRFEAGAQKCSGGQPSRRGFEASESVYLGFWMKFSENWIGSGKPYHPHLFNLFTNADGEFVGPSATHLTVYAEVNAGIPLLALQDSSNVDAGCIVHPDGSFAGCGGDPHGYTFGERRSVAACNGISGDLELRSCYPTGADWYSWRGWKGRFASFGDVAPHEKQRWQHVEVYFQLNSVADGRGVPDGRIRWVQGGQTLIESDRILFRTGAHPQMKFNQLALLPYMFDGSPRDQRMWIDSLVVATARPGGNNCAAGSN